DFLQGDYDVLVTTTIIETGVDIPNVNTLLVEDADRMGLSQLYQLRGRVGRSNRVAYAYFMYEQHKLLTEESEKRLQAIKDFTELGSGFKIAMRDLSIHGAGNLLGQQQSGFIDSVGFDLYSQMLQEAVARKQGGPEVEKTVVEIDVDVDAYIPDNYVNDQRQKIELYKRIRSLSDEEEYVELQDEFIDRFGDFPQEVDDLLVIGLIKYYSETILVETITRKRSEVHVTFSEQGTKNIPMQELFRALDGIPWKVDMKPGKQLTVELYLKPGMENYEWLQHIMYICGLGPDHLGQMPKEIYDTISKQDTLYLRTLEHPAAQELKKEGLNIVSFDDKYEAFDEDFEQVYPAIVEELIHLAKKRDVYYGVPGHPAVAETTVQLLLEK